MISRDDLKQMVMLAYLTDAMLDKLIPITEMNQFDAKEYVFKQGKPAERLYFLVKGKILLEHRIEEEVAQSVYALSCIAAELFGTCGEVEAGRNQESSLSLRQLHLYHLVFCLFG